LQIRLFDPATRDRPLRLGACTGDSGGPAFIESQGAFSVIGVVSWSTDAAATGGCGGLMGVTPLALYRERIVEVAKKFGSPLAY
jgi:secreted trypsin-like serine protease